MIWCQFCSLGWGCCSSPDEISGYNPVVPRPGRRNRARRICYNAVWQDFESPECDVESKKNRQKKVQSNNL